MINDKVKDKIRKLLNMSGNNPSDEEAHTAMLMAQKLMAKHSLSEADIDLMATEDKEVVTIDVTKYTRTPWWYKRLGAIIADNFKCMSYISYRSFYERDTNGYEKEVRRSCVRFMGLKNDAEMAKEIFQYAFDNVNNTARNYVRRVRDSGGSTKGIRNDFVLGYLRGLGDKFEEQKAEDNELALALIIDEAVHAEWNKKTFRSMSSSKATRRGSDEAYSSGYDTGKSFSKPSGFIK